MFGIVYKVTNTVNGKVYVGQTRRSLHVRQLDHLREARKGNTRLHLHRAIAKYGEQSFHWEILEEAATKEELDRLEMKWISQLQACDETKGYNFSSGGAHPSPSASTRLLISRVHKGKEVSEETREKIRKARLGTRRSLTSIQKQVQTRKEKEVWHSEETKSKISQALQGKVVSAETRQKLREANLGKHLSAETRQKMKEAHARRKQLLSG